MKKITFLIAAVSVLILDGCSIFGKYTNETTVPDNIYGTQDVVSKAAQDSSIGLISWREYFADPKLQTLIDSALIRNVDMNAAQLGIRQAEALMKVAKLAYLPSISITPSINIRPDNGYIAPVSGGWNIGGIGTITNRKREAMAITLQTTDQADYVRSTIVATIAKSYNELQLLDRQLEIVTQTEKIWGEVLETQIALMENGRAYSTSVNQMKASLLGVTLQKMDLQNAINDLESAICVLIKESPQHIDRSGWGSYRLPLKIGTGIPASMLENRADVRMAGHNLEAAFYVTKAARAAMLPGLSLTGLVGWGNQGKPISSPTEFISNAVASLTMPIFAQGSIRANIKVSKMQQQIAADQYVQAIVNAGNEVNQALRDCQLAKQKEDIYQEQVATLRDAYSATQELMKNGKASYIEVLTAQETLLSAQLNESTNIFNGESALIDLYLALGGGAK